MKKSILPLLLYPIIGQNHTIYANTKPSNLNSQLPQPKGTKQYFFDINGNFSTTQMLKSELYFTCYSINNTNAIRKFKKYKFSQSVE